MGVYALTAGRNAFDLSEFVFLFDQNKNDFLNGHAGIIPEQMDFLVDDIRCRFRSGTISAVIHTGNHYVFIKCRIPLHQMILKGQRQKQKSLKILGESGREKILEVLTEQTEGNLVAALLSVIREIRIKEEEFGKMYFSPDQYIGVFVITSRREVSSGIHPRVLREISANTGTEKSFFHKE